MRRYIPEKPERLLQRFKLVLLRFKAKRLMGRADEVWEEKSWTPDDAKRLLETKIFMKQRLMMSTRILNCSTSPENYYLCIQEKVAGFSNHGPR